MEATSTEVPSTSPSPDAQPPQSQVRRGGLYENSTDALKAVKEDFLYWTGKLTDSSFHLSLALIAANWAVFGSVQKIVSNAWAKYSLSVVIFGLALNLAGGWWMGDLHRQRIDYAGENTDRWEEECTTALGIRGPWPYTKKIERLGWCLRVLKTLLPLVAGGLFLVALFKA